MLVDLHNHYPMHIGQSLPPARALFGDKDSRMRLLDRIDQKLIYQFGRLGNHESFHSGPRVSLGKLRDGGASVACSVLLLPALEFGDRLTRFYSRRYPYGAPPRAHYFPALLRQLEAVERSIEESRLDVRIARSGTELEACLERGDLVLIHCVEGGFHLGATPGAVEAAVAELATRGVAYITLAHLFWRRVATNVPLFPVGRRRSEAVYKRLFPQPAYGLSELGRAAVRALVRHRVLIDVAHMSHRALDETFALLDELDPRRSVPVLSSHSAFRFGSAPYNADAETVARISERGGVVGLILAERFLGDGLGRPRPRSFADGFELLSAHIDRLAEITGSHAHTAIGSDLDGFIKPTLPGLENAAKLDRLRSALIERYGDAGGDIAARNVLRVLHRAW